MTGKLISSKVCIARIFDRYNIDYSGFIPRIPNWVYSCLREIDAIQSLVDISETCEVIDNRCALPYRISELVAVSYEGFRLPNIESINTKSAEGINSVIHSRDGYERSGNYILTTFETGNIVLYYKAFPIEFDVKLKVYFPLIEDNEDLLVALDWYLLKSILGRGHIVPGFSLKDNNEFTNPALAFEKSKKITRNSLLHISSELRHHINTTISKFLSSRTYYSNTEFNPYLKS
jgi:hypothetical protein